MDSAPSARPATRRQLEHRLTESVVSILAVEGPRRASIFATLSQLLRNILKHPADPRFRRLRVTNASVQRRVVNAPLVLGFLLQLGFRFQGEHLVYFVRAPTGDAAGAGAGRGGDDGEGGGQGEGPGGTCSSAPGAEHAAPAPPEAIDAVMHALYLLEEAKKVATAYASEDAREGGGQPQQLAADDGGAANDEQLLRQLLHLPIPGQAGGGALAASGVDGTGGLQEALAAVMACGGLASAGDCDSSSDDDGGGGVDHDDGHGYEKTSGGGGSSPPFLLGDRDAAGAATSGLPSAPAPGSAAATAAAATSVEPDSMQRLMQQRHAVASAYTAYRARAAQAETASAVQSATAYEGDSDWDKCDLCMEDIGVGAILPCCHLYCAPCIRRWIKSQPTCPNCRMVCTLDDVQLLQPLEGEVILDTMMRLFQTAAAGAGSPRSQLQQEQLLQEPNTHTDQPPASPLERQDQEQQRGERDSVSADVAPD